ncbi:MAG: hypothetical protein JO144_16290 [Actinobacteria bacterium]|nr:hypothetical protein [Actinomycetota bacterium]
MKDGFSSRRLLASVVAVLLTGCGSGLAPGANSGGTDGVGRAGPPSGGDPAAALAKWRSFPVTANPRPLVLVGAPVLDPATGFRTGDAKLAYVSGAFEPAVALPSTPVTSGGYALVTARAALEKLRASAAKQPVAHPVRIVAVSLGKASFGTDRGPRTLPAWRFTLDQAADPVEVLAVAPKYLWPAASAGLPDRGATLGADGRTVTYRFFGTPAGPPPCGAEYAADVAEAGTAVVLSVREVAPSPRPGSAPAGSDTSAAQGCTAIGALRTVTVTLSSPLGARVLLTSDGAPVAVVSR